MPRINRTNISLPMPRYLRRSDQLRKQCYLCGANFELEREHVFAQNLFRPDDLEEPVILSACRACNAEKERDEDYVFNFIIWTTETPEVERVRSRHIQQIRERRPPILIPGSEIPQGNRLFQSFMNKMDDIEIVSREGFYLGTGGVVPIDAKRFTDFYVRICKGLFTSASGSIQNWNEYTIKSQFDSFTYGQHWNREVYLFPWNNAGYREEWGSQLGLAGFVYSSTNVEASGWSIALYNEQLATVMFHKTS